MKDRQPTTAALARYGNKKHEERKVDEVVVDKEFIGCEQNGIWTVTSSAEAILKRYTVTVNLCPVEPRISGPLKDIRHVAFCYSRSFNGIS